MTNILSLPLCPLTAFALVTDADFLTTVSLTPSGAGSPLDLTGIAFHSQIRLAADTTQIALDLSTTNGLLVSGNTNGNLSWAVPASAVSQIAPGAYVADLIAIADGHTINLCSSPMQITVSAGLTF